MKISPILKWHGGKGDLAQWLVSLLPPRCQNPNKPASNDPGYLHYVEPYAGGLSVLLANDPEGISEVVNDRNYELTNFWRVLQGGSTFAEFKRLCEATPSSEVEWCESDPVLNQPDELDAMSVRAWRFFIRCRQSLAGRMRSFTGITRTRTRRGMNNEVSAWLSAVEGLQAVHDRLKRVLIVGPSPALEVIRKHDGPRALFYLDPTYLHETRATTTEYGTCEMSDHDHKELLNRLVKLKGKFLLSGYDSNLYYQYATAHHWYRHEKKIDNHASGAKQKRVMTEVVWCNYRPQVRKL